MASVISAVGLSELRGRERANVAGYQTPSGGWGCSDSDLTDSFDAAWGSEPRWAVGWAVERLVG